MKLTNIFDFKTGDLPALENTEDGDIPLVYGTTKNNGVEKFVKVENDDQIFRPPLITVSYLGTSFVQLVPFTTSVVDKSNIIVLVPKKPLTLEELYFYSFQINRIAKFGFNYGRRMNMRQLRKINFHEFKNIRKKIQFDKILFKVKKEHYLLRYKKLDTMPISKLFTIQNAKSKGFEQYDQGDVPFISNGMLNMGLVGYVTPYENDRVFYQDAICVSSFCESTIHNAPFLPRGNGGSGLIVLTPKNKMSKKMMIFYASYINSFYQWRFSYGRMVTKDRIENLLIPSISF